MNIYKFPTDDVSVADVNTKMNAHVPFAVVGSTDFIRVGNKMMRSREYPWGIVEGKSILVFAGNYCNLIYYTSYIFAALIYLIIILLVENESHSDFVKLREMLIRTNMEDMRDKTHNNHYELYRRKRLLEVYVI